LHFIPGIGTGLYAHDYYNAYKRDGMHGIGKQYGGQLADATIVVEGAGVVKVAPKIIPKLSNRILFKIDKGYVLKYGETSKIVNRRVTGRIEMLYGYADVKRGVTFISINLLDGICKFRFDWDPSHGFHSHPPGHSFLSQN